MTTPVQPVTVRFFDQDGSPIAALAASHNQLFTAHAGGTGPAIASKE
jgi:hypothetical protein